MNILKINSSANGANSISRDVVERIVSEFVKNNPSALVKDRNVAVDNLPHVDETFVKSMYQRGQLNVQDKEILKTSDMLINELKSSEIIVIGAPIYNFTIPSSLKSYFDLIARPGITFNMTSMGKFEGLLTGKRAIVVVTSASTKIGGEEDFSTPYISRFLRFVGITNVDFIDMDQAAFRYKEKMQDASQKIGTLTY